MAIFAAFLLASLARGEPFDFRRDVLLIGCAAGLFLLGLIDDFLNLKPYAKLVCQIVIAAAFTMGGMRLHWLASPVLDQALTIFWLVGITNALNLLDNLDGLAGGVAVIAAAYLVYFCHSAGQPATAMLAAALCGAVLGFLVFNFNPASIFMGDSGSLFLGFFLGGVTMVNNTVGMRRNVLAVLAIPVLLLLIPILDTTLVTLSRKFHSRPVTQGGKDHTSHRLVALGLSERAAALVLWTAAAASGGVAVLVQTLELPVTTLLVPAFVFVLLFFLAFVARVNVYAPVESEQEGRGRALLPTLADFAYKRRILEVLNDVAIIVLAYYASLLLRFDGELVEPYYGRLKESLPLVITVQAVSLLALGLYRGLWRYTSMADLGVLLRGVVGAWLATLVAITLVYRFEGFSRGAIVMNGILLMGGITGSRIFLRFLHAQLARMRAGRNGNRVVIYGAGDGGELLVRELLNNHDLALVPVAFLDDDPKKHGRMIHGLPVLGPLDALERVVAAQKVTEILVSTEKLDPERASMLSRLAERANLRTRRMRLTLQ